MVTESTTDIESMSQTHMVSTYRSSTISPIAPAMPRPPSDTLYSLSRVNSQSSATAPRAQLADQGFVDVQGLAHPQTMKGRWGQKLTHVRACGACSRMERCASGLVRDCGIQRRTWQSGLSVRTYGNFCYSHLDRAEGHGALPGDLRDSVGSRRTGPTAIGSRIQSPWRGKG